MNKYHFSKVVFLILIFSFLLISPSISQAISKTVSLIPNCTTTTGTNSSGISCSSMTMIEFFNAINTKQERMDVQRVLNKVLSPSPNLKVDGVFGKKTTQAVKTFQTKYGLAVDGKVGPITRTALEQAQISYSGSGGASVPTVPPINTTTPTIGVSYGGGIVAYILQAGDPSYEAGKVKGLIASTSNQSFGLRWYNGTNKITRATGTALGTGLANTNTIISTQGATATSYAAGLARAYTGGGYTDWYLPSKDELNKLYLNKTVIGGFDDIGYGRDYWSSSESGTNAWYQWFGDGGQDNGISKNAEYQVRAVRSFEIVIGTIPAPITTDVTVPSITSFTIPTSSSYTVPIISFTASDSVGVTGYKLTETYIAPTSTTSGWTATPPTSYTFTSLGTKTLYAWVKDSAGNVSSSLSRTVTITNTPNTTCPAGTTGTYPNCVYLCPIVGVPPPTYCPGSYQELKDANGCIASYECLEIILPVCIPPKVLINYVCVSPSGVLTIEGTTINNSTTGEWLGVDIPRSTPTTFTYRNNSITSMNASGYMLQAGDEVTNSTNNNLNGSVITGNKLTWNGTPGSSITHGLFTGYNINDVIKYNYLNKVPYGAVIKSGETGTNMSYTSGGFAYNIVKNSDMGVRIKGINGVNVFNNTFYDNLSVGDYFLFITDNPDIGNHSPSTGTKVKNNIFYSSSQIYNIYLEKGSEVGFESDYNIFYSESGTPMFNYQGTSKTFAQWQALGYDTHSVVINPNFLDFTNFVPNTRLNYGTNLGTTWQTGLSSTAVWTVGLAPVTANQDSAWQVGARILSTGNTLVIVTTDTTKPSVTAFSIPATYSSTTVPISAFSATDNIGVTGYYFSESSTAPTTSSSWLSSKPSSYTFSSSGTKVLFGWVRDSAGNISSTVNSNQVTITTSVVVPPVIVNPPTTGTTYYISPSGSDSGSGSSSSPWKTLASACSKVTAPGSVIHVKAGTYTETSQCKLNVGVSIEGEGITSDIHSIYSNDFTILLNSSAEGTNGNQFIRNIKMDGSNLTAYGAIKVNKRSNVEIYNNTFVDFYEWGVSFEGGNNGEPSTYATGNRFHDNVVTNCSNYYYPGSDGDADKTSGDGRGLIQISGQQTMLIYNNTLTQTGRNTWHNGHIIKGIMGFNKDIKIYNNTMTREAFQNETWDFAIELWDSRGGIEVYDNTINAGLDFSGNNSGGTGISNQKGIYDYSLYIHDNIIGPSTHVLSNSRQTKGIYVEQSAEDVIIERNHINNFDFGVYHPLTIKDDNTGGFLTNVRVNSNIFTNIYDASIYFGIDYSSLDAFEIDGYYVYNNTIIAKSGSGAIGIYVPNIGSVSDVSIRNNIVQGFSKYPVYGDVAVTGLSIENNLFYNNGNSNLPKYKNLTPTNNTTQNNLTSNPLLTSDFHLQSGSPAINTGASVGLPYNGSVPDIGAYEY